MVRSTSHDGCAANARSARVHGKMEPRGWNLAGARQAHAVEEDRVACLRDRIARCGKVCRDTTEVLQLCEHGAMRSLCTLRSKKTEATIGVIARRGER